MAKKKNKKVSERVSFLTKRKNINDKFFDIVKHTIKNIPDKKGNFKRKGVKYLADELEISTSKLTRYIKQGFIDESNDELYINVERNFEKVAKEYKIPRTKKETKQFTVHTFTFKNFFRKKNFKRGKKNEQFYFRAGLYLVFRSGKRGTYTIQNLPVSHYSNSYDRGYKEFFEIIQITLQSYPSLLHFLFNYFDVQKIDIGSVESRIQKFKAKHKSKKKKK